MSRRSGRVLGDFCGRVRFHRELPRPRDVPARDRSPPGHCGNGCELLTVRRETGKEYGVKVSDDKDIASHIDPKPCGGAREGDGEASVGACAGRTLSLENHLLGADALVNAEGNTRVLVIARASSTRRGRRIRHAQKFLVREPGGLGIDQGILRWSASERRIVKHR